MSRFNFKHIKASHIYAVVIFSLSNIFSLPLIAQENEAGYISKSINFSQKITLDQTTRDQKLNQATGYLFAADNIQKNKNSIQTVQAYSRRSSDINSDETYIYGVSTYLISDFNNDGFYHRFSLEIDVDTIYSRADVYTRIYLSYQGGPWNYFTSSDVYSIYADSSADSFTIETELSTGFEAGYYDIRIELYDANTYEKLGSYSPYDDASLSNLMLESSYYDDDGWDNNYSLDHSESVVVYGQGAINYIFLLLVVLLLSFKKLFKTQAMTIIK